MICVFFFFNLRIIKKDEIVTSEMLDAGTMEQAFEVT